MAIGCGLAILGLCVLCGIGGYFAYQRGEDAKKEYAEANRLWETGKKAEAISKYKAVLDKNVSDVPSKSERPTVYTRIAEFEIDQGNEKSARSFIERAVQEKVELQQGTKKFNDFAQVVRTDLEKREREEKSKKEAEDKKRTESQAAEEKNRRESQTANEKLAATDGLELDRESLKGLNDNFGGKITGTVVNKSGKQLRYAQITFKLYDASGAQVGSALANINGLEPGKRWNFEATSFGTKFDTYKLYELSGR